MKSQHLRGNKTIPIKVFETKKGKNRVTLIENQIKSYVLDMLSKGEMEFDDIVKNTGKSKSTISIHLKSLRKEGIVGFKLKEEDQRKKIFYIDSKQLCEVKYSNDINEFENQKLELLVSNLVGDDKNAPLISLFFQAIRTFLIQNGINADYLFHEFGVKIGAAIYEKIKSDNNEELSFNLSNFWKLKGLGCLKIDFNSNDDIIRVTVFDSLKDSILPKNDGPICFLGSGILTGVFSNYIGQKVFVKETKCYNMGDSNCLFEIEPISLPDSSMEIFN